jgi:hypothetical protein
VNRGDSTMPYQWAQAVLRVNYVRAQLASVKRKLNIAPPPGRLCGKVNPRKTWRFGNAGRSYGVRNQQESKVKVEF